MKQIKLSRRAGGVKPSPTLAIAAKAAQMKAAGEKVLSLSAGEPDFPTPEHIRRAAIAAMEAGYTGYSPSAGIPPLREAIRRQARERLGVDYSDAQVVVGCGAKQCLAHAMLALLDEGDEVIIPSPYWVSYPEQAQLCGARPVLLPLEPGGRLNPNSLKKAITAHSRLLVLNSPSNPSGLVIDADTLRGIAELVREHELCVLSDDIYDQLVYDGKNCPHLLQVAPELADRTIVVNGLSKAYSMTGWRLGWALGPQPVIAAMRAFTDQTTSCAVTFVQHAAVAALQSPPQVVSSMVTQFEKRRNRLLELLGRIPGLKAWRPQGAFYVMVQVTNFLGEEIPTDVDFAARLLEVEKVALVPGQPFGAPGFVRLSFATSLEVIEEAVERLGRFLSKRG